MQAVKINTGFRVLNRQYDCRNNLKVKLFVFGGRSVRGVSEADTRRPKKGRQIVFWVNLEPKSALGIFFHFCLHPNSYRLVI